VEARSQIVIVGIDAGSQPHYVEPLEGAGLEVVVAVKLPETLAEEVRVVLVAGEGDALAERCATARAASPWAQVVACVPRDGNAGLVNACLDAGADDVVNAPPSPGVLVARARAGVAQARTRAALAAEEDALAVIDDIAGALASGEITDGLHEASVRLSEALGFTRCAVLALPSDEAMNFYIVAASDDSTLVKLPLDARKYPELRASFETHEPVFVWDAASSSLMGDFAALAAEHGGRTILALPLLADRRPIGALLLRSTGGRDPLDEREAGIARTASRVFAAALRGGRISDTLREQTKRLSLASYQEERRSRALEQYRDFFESAADGVVVVDGSGAVLYVNRAAEQLTGYARGGLSGKAVTEIVVESQREGLREVLEQAASGVHLAGFDLQIVTTSSEPLRVSVSTSAALA
jgi:PAS domain-containing protein/DNA-binding response OmpR family regulator